MSAAQLALPPNLDRALVNGRNRFEKALKDLIAAKEEEAQVATEKKDVAGAVDALAKNCIAVGLKQGSSAAKGHAEAGKPAPAETDLAMLRSKLKELRENAAKITKDLARQERKADRKIASANADLAASCDVLNGIPNLRRAMTFARAGM